MALNVDRQGRARRSTGTRVRTTSGAVALALMASLVPIGPAEALTVTTAGTERVLGELTSQRLDIRLDGGQRVRGDALRFRDSSDLQLRPHLAGGTATGTLGMTSMIASEYPRGALAGVNGGYFVPRPNGNPNGLFVDRGRLIAGRAVGTPSGAMLPRGVAGIQQNGTIVADRLDVELFIDASTASPPLASTTLDDINRAPVTDERFVRDDLILLYDARFGRNVTAPEGSTVLIADDLALGSSGRVQGAVREVLRPSVDRSLAVASGTSMIVATGARTRLFDGVTAGMPVGVEARVRPLAGLDADWQNLRGAIPGAGLLIRNSAIQPVAQMSAEGINHASTRRARTAVGRLGDGGSLIVTVDEGAGWSTGVTLFELAKVMQELGAVEALALDGGGSTTMAVKGAVTNRPSDPNRGHSSALFVYASLPPESRGILGACPEGSVPGGGFGDTAGSVHGNAIDCLAWWQITRGITETSFDPGGSVTRQQMASFLARWLDVVAEQGSGQALPPEGTSDFEDVSESNTHAVAIDRLTSVGIIQGRTSTIFDPGTSVSRAETATLLRRAVEYTTGTELPPARDTFTDDNGSTHEPAIDQLAAAEVIGGIGGFDYAPNLPVTRAAMSSLVMRASDLLVEQGRTTPPAG